jgi:hypothetical protein
VAKLNIFSVDPRGEISGEHDTEYTFVVEFRGDCDSERRHVRVPGSESVEAGFGHDGPSAAWVTEQLVVQGPLPDNYRPVLDQVREWPDPLYLIAHPK